MSKKTTNEDIPSSADKQTQKTAKNLPHDKSEHIAKRGAALTKEIEDSKKLGETFRAGHQGKDTLKEKVKHDEPNGHAEKNDDKLEQEFEKSQLH
jgi:hypothetical protein